MTKFKSRYLKGKSFETKEELFDELRGNIEMIISSKTAKIQKSYKKKQQIKCRQIDLSKYAEQNKGIAVDKDSYYIAVNSTRILDSHQDVHGDGLWNRSVSQIQGKNYLVADHCLATLSTIVRKEHIEIFTAIVPFAAIGCKYEGFTEILVYKFKKNKVIIPAIKEWLDSGDDIQASVRMQYVKIIACFDSLHPDDKEFKKNYDEYVGLIANKDDFEYIPYFFWIKEAKNVRESSLVLFGSNHATGLVTDDHENDEPLKNTHDKNDPPDGTQKTDAQKKWEDFKNRKN